MMRWGIFAVSALVLSLGCARVRVEAPQEPIKVDISMRLDVYQHVQNDIDAIEGMVSGPVGSQGQSFLNFFVSNAYAQESLGSAVEEAASRRKERRSELLSWQRRGLIGEDRLGLLEIRSSETVGSILKELVTLENTDRMIIYKAVARKNGASVEEVQQLYAKRLQADAPAGTPIEALDVSMGFYTWRRK